MTDRENDDTLGVYQDRQRAEAAAERARAAGVDESRIRVGDDADSVASLEAEMRDEMEQAWISPQAAFIANKESAKGMSLVTPIAAAVGILVTLPLALIFSFGGMSVWLRVLIGVAVGALGGGTVGFIMGGGLAIKGPDKALAAERGVTVRVDDAGDEVVSALGEEELIRLDTVTPAGRKTSTVETEEERTSQGVVEDLAQTARQPEGDWSRTQRRERDSDE